MKFASETKIEAVTFDGAGGGTGMSPVPMLDEMNTPTVYLEAQVLKCAEILKKKGKHVPDIMIAGGFTKESQLLKALAMSNFGNGPYVKAVLMARSALLSVMKSSYFVELSENGKLPRIFAERYGLSPDKFFIATPELKTAYGERFKDIPWQAVGFYTYLNERLKVGLMQLLAGTRKWKLDLLDRNDLVALTERASKVTGIPLVEDAEKDAIERILD
jgi:glutamate synthase domain-containing protein 2